MVQKIEKISELYTEISVSTEKFSEHGVFLVPTKEISTAIEPPVH